MRLIDADELIENWKSDCRITLEKNIDYIDSPTEDVFNDFIRDVQMLPTIDAVEIVRCKDCKYRLHLQATSCHPEQYLCRLDDRTFYPSRKANNPEWFCADGERRTDETD